MRLLRLTSDKTNGVFEGYLNSPLVLKENSKIALGNIAFQVDKREIDVNISNNRIVHKLSGPAGTNQITIFLEERTYTENEIGELALDITNRLNNSMKDQVGGLLGYQYRALIDRGDKFEIALKKADLNNFKDTDNYEKTTQIQTRTQSTETVFSRTQNQNTAGEYFFVRQQICKGYGQIRTQIYNFTGTGAEYGFITALVDKNPDNFKYTQRNEFTYAVWCPNVNDTILIQTPSNPGFSIDTGSQLINTTNADPKKNDIVEIVVIGNAIVFNQYYWDGSAWQTNELYRETIVDKKLYPLVNIRNSDAVLELWRCRFQNDPFIYQASNLSVNDEQLGALPNYNNSRTLKSFEMNEGLASQLGFSRTEFPEQLIIGYTFTADISLDLSIKNDNFIVEMLSLDLESYDTLINQKASILNTIPDSDEDNGVVIYTPSNLLFVDINNSQKISLRNIRCRVLRNDRSGIITRGLGTMLLVID